MPVKALRHMVSLDYQQKSIFLLIPKRYIHIQVVFHSILPIYMQIYGLVIQMDGVLHLISNIKMQSYHIMTILAMLVVRIQIYVHANYLINYMKYKIYNIFLLG